MKSEFLWVQRRWMLRVHCAHLPALPAHPRPICLYTHFPQIWLSFQSSDTPLAREQPHWLCLRERKGAMISKNNENWGLQVFLPGKPAYPHSRGWLTLGYVRPEGEGSPPLLHPLGRWSQLGQEAGGSICDHHTRKGQINWEIFLLLLLFFLFVCASMSQTFQISKEGEKGKSIILLQAGWAPGLFSIPTCNPAW